jgi:pimeloyl-ACP methyl ester carboxylesterase
MARVPLILLPGLLCDARLWRYQVEHLADLADVRVADLTGADSLGALADGVLEDAPREFALAGLSMGGYVAQEIMRRAPERVLRLALVDTSARADTEEQRARRRGLLELAEKGEFHGVTDRLLPLLVAEARLQDTALTSLIKDMARAVGRDAFLRQQTAIMGRPDGRGDLARIRCPTLVLCGRQDALAPPEIHREMAEGIPSATLVVIEECGHLAPLEQPVATTAVLRYWLQAETAPRRAVKTP